MDSETPAQKITRTSERLRHKFRAVTPWDYERLVLDNFSDVFKVKCFSSMTSKGGLGSVEPGSVLIVIVPHQSMSGGFELKLDQLRIRAIQAFLEQCSSGQVRIEVRNPSYERVLIRCAVRLTGDARRQPGIHLKRLNQDLVDYISPWSATGPTPRFGWSFQTDEVKAFIRGLPYIDFVTQLSLLHVSHDDQNRRYAITDTARPLQSNVVSPVRPWSLAVPHQTHILQSVDQLIANALPAPSAAVTATQRPDIPPAPTGIGLFEIGATFIVGE